MQAKSRNILLPAFGLCALLFLVGLILLKKFCRYRRPVMPYNRNPQLAYITPTYYQQQPVWPLPPVEQPPSYYTVINQQMIPPTMSYIKQ